jgi:putative transposase
MPRNYQVSAHTRYFIRYHIVWIVKRRREVLANEKIAQRLVEVLREVGEHYETRIIEIGADKDHLHLFCEALPEKSPSWVVHKLKGISARIMRQEFPGLKQGYLEGSLWGTGYYLATVGYQSNEAAVRAYVRLQGKSLGMKDYRQLAIFSQ